MQVKAPIKNFLSSRKKLLFMLLKCKVEKLMENVFKPKSHFYYLFLNSTIIMGRGRLIE
jgi:hypothetical protein